MAGWTFSYACIAIMWIAAAGAWLWGGSLVAALALTGGAVGAPVYLAAIYWLYLPKVGRRQFAQYAALRDAAEMSWDSVAVTFSSVRYTSRTSWSDYRRWAEDSRVYRIYPVDGQYHVIPKRAFTSPADEAAFRACLESIGKPAVRG
ncbi:MAG: YcxB family protein [Alphaproteobacteria bacterium]|nr:YcxB family protein [Alphaproteobacteria bacterium]